MRISSVSSGLVLAVVTSFGCATARAPFDVLIVGGEILDGTGSPARRLDVGIRDNAIAAIGELATAEAERVIDATGLVVTPGFIDMHGHSDFTLLVDGRALSKVTQGVTTELLGESSSAGPVLGPARPDREKELADLGLELDWTTLGEYFERLERQGTSINILSAVGSGQVRASVVGYENRAPTEQELARMVELVEQAMQDGAVGLSSGLIYPPNSYASTEELIALAEVVSRHGGLYITHIRNEGDRILEALDEAIRVGREAELPVEVLHFKRSGVRVDGSSEEPTARDAVALIERARREGVSIYANQYPYHASQTTLGVRLPDWAHEGGTERLLERLRDSEIRQRLSGEVAADLARGVGGATPETVLFGATPYEPHKRFQGMYVAGIAKEMGVPPSEAILELIDKADGRARAIFFGMREEDVRYLMALDWVTVGSDGSAVAPEGILARTHPHPRWYGTFPRVVGHYVREEKVLMLPEAVRKMTSLPASRLGLEDRGTLAEGYKADITIFDPEHIVDRSTFEEPHQFSEGVRYLLVNGTLVLDEGRHTTEMPGRVLRRRASKPETSASSTP